ncbi:MAG: TonB-dependent receptor, partial [Candidatus Binatus sp.]
MRFFQYFLSSMVALALSTQIARAQEPASTSSPAQTQTTKTAPAPKKATKPTTTPTKQEAQKLNPVVVTATRIPQPIGEIGTTITVVEDPQIQEQKIQRVEDVLREVPGVQVTQSGSPG